jgi:hypothetical protein
MIIIIFIIGICMMIIGIAIARRLLRPFLPSFIFFPAAAAAAAAALITGRGSGRISGSKTGTRSGTRTHFPWSFL